ncbi:MAG TPA: hypothetical protein VHZ76_01455, partial [Gammaproteobacteria bacterium]|nr:hypothetical protein [Gammaproteobacteria bacterium]
MRAYHTKKQINPTATALLTYCVGAAFLLSSNLCFANLIVITGNNIINKPTTYKNDVLDMTNGRFTIKNGGSLEIENSIINSTISSANPYLANLTDGSVSLKNNTVNVSVDGITPNANSKPAYHLIEIQRGLVDISNNSFLASTAFTLGFLETQEFKTNGINISKNKIKNF